jgi:hypothetical protein
MTHQSEERVPSTTGDSPQAPASAQILPFERPQSDLQRAIQLRAQEAIDRDRDRDREERRPQPLKWLIILLIAAIPVVLIFGAVDGFLRAFYKINETYNSAPPPAQVEQAPATENVQTTPGVVLLQPYDQPAPPVAAPAPDEKQAPPSN